MAAKARMIKHHPCCQMLRHRTVNEDIIYCSSITCDITLPVCLQGFIGVVACASVPVFSIKATLCRQVNALNKIKPPKCVGDLNDNDRSVDIRCALRRSRKWGSGREGASGGQTLTSAFDVQLVPPSPEWKRQVSNWERGGAHTCVRAHTHTYARALTHLTIGKTGAISVWLLKNKDIAGRLHIGWKTWR